MPQDVQKIVSVGELNELCRRLLRHRNDPIGVAVATRLTQAYECLPNNERSEFFDLLLEEYSADSERIIAAAQSYQNNPGYDTHLALAKAVQTPRQTLFQSINLAPDGTRALVKMREDLLLQSTPRRVRLREVDHDLRQLLQSWFNRGFLEVQRIDWDSSASLLEKIITYEAVHEINGWEGLRRRLQEDRRCFAFFHPSMAGEPLVFVEVALTNNVAGAIQPVLARDSRVRGQFEADTAMFYSISNCQTGLRGVSFGGFLIKQAVDELRRELHQLRVFATLSPVPHFRTWLQQQVGSTVGSNAIVHEAAQVQQRLVENPQWYQDKEMREAMRSPLMHLCAHFLLHEKLDTFPIDPVARFHLGNGASLFRINWLADLSQRALEKSAGVMVNYLYELGMIERNHDLYVKEGRVTASKEVQTLANSRVKPGIT